MKCSKCRCSMEYSFGTWECECGHLESFGDCKTSATFLISDEEDFYCTDEKYLHLS